MWRGYTGCHLFFRHPLLFCVLSCQERPKEGSTYINVRNYPEQVQSHFVLCNAFTNRSISFLKFLVEIHWIFGDPLFQCSKGSFFEFEKEGGEGNVGNDLELTLMEHRTVG